jgi:Na+/melibiose symporter-like transporter
MKAKRLTSVGALHPILFFAVMYVVVLFLSIFICSSLFYSLNADTSEEMMTKLSEPAKQSGFPVQVSTAAVVR